eukprot:Gb_25897 [translate_table: standard]
MVWEISLTFTNGKVPVASRGNSSENEVYLHIEY